MLAAHGVVRTFQRTHALVCVDDWNMESRGAPREPPRCVPRMVTSTKTASSVSCRRLHRDLQINSPIAISEQTTPTDVTPSNSRGLWFADWTASVFRCR
jgi:hypothetical protein